jgi:hypothetical protein
MKLKGKSCTSVDELQVMGTEWEKNDLPAGDAMVMKLLRTAWEMLKKQFEPHIKVGNPDRARKKGELDGDEEHLNDLNKTWREMLQEDPWRKKLMTHVSLLTSCMGIFFLVFWLGGLYLPAKHTLFNYVSAGVLATLPYWIWVGRWHARIEKKVFGEFKKRFGKHHHLK